MMHVNLIFAKKIQYFSIIKNLNLKFDDLAVSEATDTEQEIDKINGRC